MANYNFKQVETKLRKYWKDIDLLNKLQHKNEKNKKYFLLDGPPYANFIPHVGHIRNTVYKDLSIRLAYMKGMDVHFQPGFDCHGLPTENKVEKELEITSKKDIENMGIDKFTKACKDWAITHKDIWLNVYDELGSWYSWKKPYLTFDNSYIQSGWWTFKKAYDNDLIYEGDKPVFWCPKCETALAGYEVTDSYKMVSDPLIYIKFKVKNTENDYFLVFTTTPWTLLSNVAIVAHPDEDYVKVETMHGNLILAKERLSLFGELEMGFRILDEFKGKELDQMEYEPIVDVPMQQKLCENSKTHRVYMSIPILKERVASKIAAKKNVGESKDLFEHFVTVNEGTGLVHTAPGHGKSDNEVGKHYHLPEVSPLNDQCKFTEDGGKWEGVFVKDADKDIIDYLESNNKLIYSGKIDHKYPLCWRCKAPLIFRMSNQWFFKVSPLRQKMLDENSNVNWLPKFANERFENWVVNAEDWNISRQRYWGIPMPIWKCKSCNKTKVVGSLNELKENSFEKISDDFDLHNVNQVTLKCDCGDLMVRINDIFDVWFDSGIAPWASLGYPFNNKETFEKYYPVARINESQDQIRGWFYSLMFCSVATFDMRPYDTVSMPGWVLDGKGEKMSKSVGNIVSAKDGLDMIGGDSLRWYFFSDIAPYQTMKFNIDFAKKEMSKFFNILWNLTNLLINSKLDLIDIFEVNSNNIEDKWILSRLNTVARQYNKDIEHFEYHSAGRSLMDLVINDLSREYIQLVRERLDTGEKLPLKIIAKLILNVIKLMAPVAPYITDEIYLRIKDKSPSLKESIHLEDWPAFGESDNKLEKQMRLVKPIVQAILNLREKAKLNLRWPLKEVLISTKDDSLVKAITNLNEIILKQTNVRDLSIKEVPEVKVLVKGDYKKIGPRFEKDSAVVIAHIATHSGETILNKINNEGKYVFTENDTEFVLLEDDLIKEIHIQEPYMLNELKTSLVIINTERNDELDGEGYYRELVRRTQMLRKNSGLNKDDKINLFVTVSKSVYLQLSKWEEALAQKTGATKITLSEQRPTEEYSQSSIEKIKGREFIIFFNSL